MGKVSDYLQKQLKSEDEKLKKIEEFKKNFQDKAWLEENIEPYI